MTECLEKLILDNWEDWAGGEKPEHLDFLKIHAGSAIRNKKVGFFVFSGDKPIIFAKTVREKEYNQIIEDGFRRLKEIFEILGEDSVPRPIFLGEFEGISFSVETAIVGKQFHSMKTDGDLRKFWGWFKKFQRLMMKRGSSNRAFKDYLSDLIDKFLSLYELNPELTGLIKDSGENIIKNTGNLNLLSIIQHGDLTSDNVIYGDGRIRIIDWDNFSKIDLPMFDLLVFLQRWSGIRNIDFIDKYRGLIEDYLKEFNIDRRLLKGLVFSYFLLDFMRKKETLTDYDKEYLEERLKEIKGINF
jgi:hypothetical protein